MKIRLRPLDFKYVGNGTVQAVALGNLYSMKTHDFKRFTASVLGYSIEASGDKFQAQVLSAILGNGTIERCAFLCQQHFESGVADFIAPAEKVAGK